MRRLLAAGLFAVFLSACGRHPRPAGPVRLNLFAAASLGPALEQLAPRWQAAHPNVTLVPNLAGTQQLRAQIEGGAPVDVFVSASTTDAMALRQAGLLEALRPFVSNRLALGATPRNTRVRVFDDALQPGVKLLVCGPAVPAGKCAGKALTTLAGQGRQAQVKALRANFVSEEYDVAAVRSKVSLGEADAGFVYETDVKAAKLVDVPLPEALRIETTYALACASRSAHLTEALEFCHWLAGDEAKSVLHSLGFRTEGLTP